MTQADLALFSGSATDKYDRNGQDVIAPREGVSRPPFSASTSNTDKKESSSRMSYSERKAMQAKMEKEAAEMHPAMRAQQEKMKAKMDDKDGDGKPEPDSEEVSKEERIEKLKSYADKKKMQKTACLFDMVLEKVAYTSTGAEALRQLRQLRDEKIAAGDRLADSRDRHEKSMQKHVKATMKTRGKNALIGAAIGGVGARALLPKNHPGRRLVTGLGGGLGAFIGAGHETKKMKDSPTGKQVEQTKTRYRRERDRYERRYGSVPTKHSYHTDLAQHHRYSPLAQHQRQYGQAFSTDPRR